MIPPLLMRVYLLKVITIQQKEKRERTYLRMKERNLRMKVITIQPK